MTLFLVSLAVTSFSFFVCCQLSQSWTLPLSRRVSLSLIPPSVDVSLYSNLPLSSFVSSSVVLVDTEPGPSVRMFGRCNRSTVSRSHTGPSCPELGFPRRRRHGRLGGLTSWHPELIGLDVEVPRLGLIVPSRGLKIYDRWCVKKFLIRSILYRLPTYTGCPGVKRWGPTQVNPRIFPRI